MDGFGGRVFGLACRECSSGSLGLLSVRASVRTLRCIGVGRFGLVGVPSSRFFCFAGEQVSDTLASGSEWKVLVVAPGVRGERACLPGFSVSAEGRQVSDMRACFEPLGSGLERK